MTIVANTPAYRVTLNGKDVSSKIRPRLIAISVTSKREDADQLDITIDDTDGLVDLPATGDVLHVEIGWSAGPDVTVGLIDKGDFKIDQISHSGPPDTITLRGRAVDFTKASEIRTRRSQGWQDRTLGAVVTEIAQRRGLKPSISDDLASVPIAAVHQSRESDIALLRRLGRENDAVATIKAGTLIFAQIGATTTASGAAKPTAVFRRRDGDQHSYDLAEREDVAGVSASYHDRDQAKHVKVIVGEEKGAKHLSHVYASKESAQRAAKAAKSRAARAPASMSYTAALGRAEVYPEQNATVTGYKKQIDETKWLISEVTHTIADRGFTTQVKLETAP